ncbi:MAG: ribose-phosphate diphosphokinase [Zetaproteobacteria bacterium]|nr:MAG: ribose-phosphate diphosphokinase [Zetaproteobacteria bacterium]
MISFLGFSDYAAPAHRLAERLGLPYHEIDIHRFPDGEHRLRLPLPLAKRVIICRSLNNPNAKLIDLMLAASTAREHGAEEIALVAPYLCYMRQDKAFLAGEAVSQRIIGRWLASMFDALLTVDPHLHRIRHLKEAIPLDQAMSISASEAIATALRKQNSQACMLVGPDEESEPWVAALAAHCQLDYLVGRKKRFADREVAVSFPEAAVSGRHCILVDDIISSGETLARAAEALMSLGARSIECVVTHCLADAEAIRRLQESGIRIIRSTDSVPNTTASIQLAPWLADGLRQMSWL